jgi:hypothetical protein
MYILIMRQSRKYFFLTLFLIFASLGLILLRSYLLKAPTADTSTVPLTRISINDNQDISISASKNSAAGILPDTSFLLTSKVALSAKTLADSLKFQPEIKFKVDQKDDQNYEITPNAPLEKTKIYQIILPSLVGGVQAQDYTWAFQVLAPLKITGSYPGDRSTRIPTNASIEVYFNNPEITSEATNYFEITPKLGGHFEKHQNSLVYVHSGLSPSTLYTVTLKAGLPLTDNSQKLDKDYTFQFETDTQAKTSEKRFNFVQTIYEVTPNQPAFVTLQSYDLPGNAAKAHLYQLSESQFADCLKQKAAIPLWSYYTKYHHRCSPPATSAADFEVDLKSSGEYGSRYLEIPQNLNQPYYLLELENPDSATPAQALIETSQFAWYYWFGSQEGILWTNSLANQQPVSSVSLSINGQTLGATDNRGFLKFTTPKSFQDSGRSILTLKSANSTVYNLVEPNASSVYYWDGSPSGQVDPYWSYLYTDRSLYQPTDKINFWGIAKTRRGQNIEKVTAKLYPPSYWYEEEKNVEPLLQSDLAISSFGTYQGSFDLSNVNPGWYTLTVYDSNGQVVDHKGFSVEKYSKPAFKITVKPEKLAVKTGESNRFILQASFYDGTPVANTLFSWRQWGINSTKGEVTTDVAGRAVIDVGTQFTGDPKSYWPKTAGIEIWPSDQQEGQIASSSSFYVFSGDLRLSQQSKWDQDSNSVKGTVTVQKYDFSKLLIDPWNRDHPPVPSQKVTLSINREWYEKIEDGQYYDPINKTSQKRYRYEHRTESVGSQELTTNSQGKAEFTFSASPKEQYRLSFSTFDSSNRLSYLETYIYASLGYQQDTLLLAQADKTNYKTDDPVTVKLTSNDQPAPSDGANQYLYIVVQEGKVLNYEAKPQSSYTFAFNSQYIPNVYVRTVWFNGKTFIEPNSWYGRSVGLLINYDESQRQLKINLKPDKSKYQPGDQVNLQVEALDVDLKPQRAKVILSAIDESLSNLAGIPDDDLLSDLYTNLTEGSLLSYGSHFQNFMPESGGGGGAERGGGGGDRTNLIDAALFKEVETDTNGLANISFKLPDNITSWRLTALGVNSELFAGNQYILLPVTKPMFVNVVTSQEFISADRPKITVIAYGDSLRDGSQIKFNLTSSSLGLNQSQVGKAFVPLDFDLGQLKPGKHQLRVEAVSDSLQDALIRPIEVAESRLLLPQTEFVNLSSAYQPNWQSPRPVTVFLIDKGLGHWYPYLQSLSQSVYFGANDRFDRQAAQSLAVKLINQYFEEEIPATTTYYGRYQKDGGVTLLPGGSPDLFLSAKVAAAHLSEVDQSSLESYLLTNFLHENDLTRASAALWGLAELGRPELNTIQNLSQKDNTPEGKLYLALAAAALGDEATARTLLNQVLNGNLVEQSPYKFLSVSQDSTTNRNITSLAAILTARLNNFELTDAFWNYLGSTYSSDNLIVLERAIGLDHLLKYLPKTATTFTYTLNGQKTQKTLTNGEYFRLTVTPDNFAGFKVEPVSGQLTLLTRGWQKVDPNTVTPNSNATVSLHTSPSSALNGSEFVEIYANTNIVSNPTNQTYLVTINLPSGLRYIDNPYLYRPTPKVYSDYYSWPYSINGNQLTFVAPQYPSLSGTIHILARPVNKGSFVFEPSIIYAQNTADTVNFSPPVADIVVK